MSENIIKFPTKYNGKRKPPKPPKKKTAVAPADNSGKRPFIFQYAKNGVPAILAISVAATSDREAVGAAYLVADSFSEWAIKQLRP